MIINKRQNCVDSFQKIEDLVKKQYSPMAFGASRFKFDQLDIQYGTPREVSTFLVAAKIVLQHPSSGKSHSFWVVIYSYLVFYQHRHLLLVSLHDVSPPPPFWYYVLHLISMEEKKFTALLWAGICVHRQDYHVAFYLE